MKVGLRETFQEKKITFSKALKQDKFWKLFIIKIVQKV
jgi:hypothetical protein